MADANYVFNFNFDNVEAAIANGPSDLQQLIELGQSEVLSNLESGSVGISENDPITSSGEGNSSTSGVAFDFVSADPGTVDPVSGNELVGQVDIVVAGESTPLFTLGTSGPITPASTDQLSLTIGQQGDTLQFTITPFGSSLLA